MSTSSTARSSSSSGHVRSTAEPHLYIPPIKEFPALPKKPVKPPAPRLSLVNEKKVLRRLKKKAITNTAKGSPRTIVFSQLSFHTNGKNLVRANTNKG